MIGGCFFRISGTFRIHWRNRFYHVRIRRCVLIRIGLERVTRRTDVPVGIVLLELTAIHHILTASGDIATRMSQGVKLTAEDSDFAGIIIKLNILQLTTNSSVIDIELMSIAPQRTIYNQIIQNDRTSARTGATAVTISSTLYVSVAQRKRFTQHIVLDIEVGAHVITTQIHRPLWLRDKHITQTRNIIRQYDIWVFFCRTIDGRLQSGRSIACIDLRRTFLDERDIFHFHCPAIGQRYRGTFLCRTRSNIPVCSINRTACHFHCIGHIRHIGHFHFHVVSRHSKGPLVVSHFHQVKARFARLGQRITGLHHHPRIIEIIDIRIKLYGIAVWYNYIAISGCCRVELIHTAVEGVCAIQRAIGIMSVSVERFELTTVDSYRTRCAIIVVVVDVFVSTATNHIIVTIGEDIPAIDIL